MNTGSVNTQLYRMLHIKHTHSIEETTLKVFRRLDLIEVPCGSSSEEIFCCG